MRKIFKNQLTSYYEELELPKNLKVVHFEKQNEVPCMWYEFDTDAPLVATTIMVFGTGHIIEDDSFEHIGTIQDRGYVWHYYMKQPHGFKD